MYFEVPVWKRATTFVFMLRFLLKKHANKKWYLWSRSDYEFGVRAFMRYKLKDKAIIESSPLFQEFPDTWKMPSPARKKRQLALDASKNTTTDSGTEPPKKFTCKVTLESSDED